MSDSSVFIEITHAVEESVEQIKKQIESRSYRVANELRNSAQMVLRGQRSGRVYKKPGTHGKRMSKATKNLLPDYGRKLRGGVLYRASAPGEPPAVRTGAFRMSWQPTTYFAFDSYIARIESDLRTDNGRYGLGDILEEGTGKMAPRPHHDKIIEKTMPTAQRIYDEPYF